MNPSPQLLSAQIPDMLFEAGEIALRHYRGTQRQMQNKAVEPGQDYDPVTAADVQVESHIRAHLQQLTPDYGFCGEESGGEIGAGYCWILDPIDGTRAFVSGIPVWGILLGLLCDGVPQWGWCYQPFTGELFYGDNSSSTLLRGGQTTPLRTSGCERIEDAIMSSTYPQGLDSVCSEKGWEAMDQSVRLSRFGVDCYGFCMVAMGQIDFQVDGNLQPYDILPLAPIVRGAGGVLTDHNGNFSLEGGSAIACCTPQLHEEVMRYLDTHG